MLNMKQIHNSQAFNGILILASELTILIGLGRAATRMFQIDSRIIAGETSFAGRFPKSHRFGIPFARTDKDDQDF
jgi:hypothetical protein